MYWILAALVVLVTLLVPRLRIAGLVGCVVLAALMAWALAQRWAQNKAAEPQEPIQRRGAPTSPGIARIALPAGSVQLRDSQLTGSGAPFELRGAVANESRDIHLRTMTMRVTRRDCFPEAIDPSGCVILWQDNRRINVSVRPQEVRQFSELIWPHAAVRRARGEVKDEFEVISASGEPMPSE